METIIVACLLIVIVLLLHDKIVINRVSSKKGTSPHKNPVAPEIMGKPKQVARQAVPSSTTSGQNKKPAAQENTFDLESSKESFAVEIPQEELDDVFSDGPDLEEEEEDWRGYGAPNGEGGFATGVTYEELSTVGSLLQQEVLEPALHERAVDIVHKVQGTDLFSLLQSSMPGAAQKIARLLDQSTSMSTDAGSSTMRDKGLGDFNIGEFV